MTNDWTLPQTAPILALISYFIAITVINWQKYPKQIRAAEQRAAVGLPGVRMPVWIWVFLLTVGAIIAYVALESVRRETGAPLMSERSIVMIGFLLIPWSAVVGLIAALYVRAYCRPTNRIVRLIERQRLAEATVLIQARLARRQAESPARDPGVNPYEAPGAATSPGERQAEADDWNNLGIIAMKRRDWSVALSYFERSEAIDAAHPFLPQSNRGMALIALGQIDEGVALVERTIAGLPAQDFWIRAVFGMLLAERLIEAGRLAEARPIFDQALAHRQQATALPRSARREFAAKVTAARARLVAADADFVASGSRSETPTVREIDR